MALPRIQSYALPTASEIPMPRVRWHIDVRRAVLLVHDMQRYFVNAFPADTSPIAPVTANIQALRQHCAHVGIPVIYSAQPGRQARADRGLQADFWGPGMSDAPEHHAIIDALAPSDTDLVLTKWRYNAFQRTNLEPWLHARHRDQLIVTGVYAHIGCLLTAADAFMRDIEPFFVADAVADFSREQHDAAVRYVSGHCAVPVTTAQILEVQ